MTVETATITTKKPARGKAATSSVVYTEPLWARMLLIGVAVAFLGVMVIVPVANIFSEAFAKGTGFYMEALRDEDTISALNLSLKIAAVVVPLNAIFGLTAAALFAAQASAPALPGLRPFR